MPGFSMGECDRTLGDEIERIALWNGRTELKEPIGTPVRLRVKMKSADLHSLRFR